MLLRSIAPSVKHYHLANAGWCAVSGLVPRALSIGYYIHFRRRHNPPDRSQYTAGVDNGGMFGPSNRHSKQKSHEVPAGMTYHTDTVIILHRERPCQCCCCFLVAVFLNFGQQTGFCCFSGFPQGHLIYPNGICYRLSHLCQTKWTELCAAAKPMPTNRAAVGVLAPDMIFPIPFPGLLLRETGFLFS